MSTGELRRPAVAGTFYPDDPAELRALVRELLERAGQRPSAWAAPDRPAGPPIGLLVPHAGLVYSGVVAAAAWRLLDGEGGTIVLLGTNHRAGWLEGVGAWERGAWSTPLGEMAVDAELASAIVALGPPFGVDRAAHLGEHSLEVQLPLLQAVDPAARIVPLAVSAGVGPGAVAAGRRLGALLADRARAARIHLVISTDMAHYPAHERSTRVTADLLPSILAADAEGLARREESIVRAGIPGVDCGMCGIQPAVLGLAALHAWGAAAGVAVSAATSFDAGGPRERTVGYLGAAFGPGPEPAAGPVPAPD